VLIGGKIRNLRRDFKIGRLSPDRIQIVESLPGWEWTPTKRRRPSHEQKWAKRNIKVLTWYSSVKLRQPLKTARHQGVTVYDAISSLRKQIKAGTLRDEDRTKLLKLDPQIVNRLFLSKESRFAERDIQVLTWYSTQKPRPPIRKTVHRGVTVEAAIKSLLKQIKAGTLRDDDRTKLLKLDPEIVNRLFP
jgi:hypothetical protein